MHSQSLIDMISSSHCCHNCRNAFAKSIRDLAIFEMLQRWKNIARDQKCEDKISAVLVQIFFGESSLEVQRSHARIRFISGEDDMRAVGRKVCAKRPPYAASIGACAAAPMLYDAHPYRDA